MAALGKIMPRRVTSFVKVCAHLSRIRPDVTACDDAPYRFLQKRPIVEPALPPDRIEPYLPTGGALAESIRALNGSRIRLDGLAPPRNGREDWRVTVDDVRKVLRATQMEAIRERLRALPHSCVSYVEFSQICREEAGGEESGNRVASLLEDSGSVIVLRNNVFLRPELVARAIEHVISESTAIENHSRERDELQAMEKKKAEIDTAAAAQVKQELWAGLGFLILQTIGFMRLTFWELSWDVMEPICFFVTSFYFMAGYSFFLRTTREPSFEGFFQSRFAAKQKRLMKVHCFDLTRFDQLRRAYPITKPLQKQDIAPCFHQFY